MNLQLNITSEAVKFNNSAGRLLFWLKLLDSNASYFDGIAKLYNLEKIKSLSAESLKAKAYLDFMPKLVMAYEEFLRDLEADANMPDPTKVIVRSAAKAVAHIVYSTQPTQSPRTLSSDADICLTMAATLMQSDRVVEKSDLDAIRKSVAELQSLLEGSDLKASVRKALLEIMRLSRNAIDYHAIYGTRGFRDNFKKMLAELMELYMTEGKELTKETWWSKLQVVLTVFESVLQKADEYKALIFGAKKLFLEDHSIDTSVGGGG